MASAPQIPTRDTARRIQRIQAITLIWMSVEAAASLSAASIARTAALLAFGGDSAVELLVVQTPFGLRRARADLNARLLPCRGSSTTREAGTWVDITGGRKVGSINRGG